MSKQFYFDELIMKNIFEFIPQPKEPFKQDQIIFTTNLTIKILRRTRCYITAEIFHSELTYSSGRDKPIIKKKYKIYDDINGEYVRLTDDEGYLRTYHEPRNKEIYERKLPVLKWLSDEYQDFKNQPRIIAPTLTFEYEPRIIEF